MKLTPVSPFIFKISSISSKQSSFLPIQYDTIDLFSKVAVRTLITDLFGISSIVFNQKMEKHYSMLG